MKIAIVTSFPANPEFPKGGVEAVSVNLVRALAQFNDLEIHVVTLDKSYTDIDLSSWNGVTIHRLPREKKSELLNAIGRGRKQIYQYLTNLAPDVVHAHDTYGIMVKGLPIPRVFTIHGFIYADTLLSNQKWPWVRSKIWKWVENRSWADQPHIISISPYVRERLSGIAKGIIHDIDNPISEQFFNIKRNEEKNIIFSASVITPRKNTLTLIDAFQHLIDTGMDIELRLAGTITEHQYGELVKERIKQKSLNGRVKLLGRINTEQVKLELAKASIFALVSLEENSPLGIEEAMASGVPVVTSNRCGMPYMIRHGESGYLVNPLDTLGIAKRIKSLIENDKMRKDFGDLSRKIALDRFHPEKVSCRTRNVYIQAIAE